MWGWAAARHTLDKYAVNSARLCFVAHTFKLDQIHTHTQLAQSIKICLAWDCSVDNDLSLGTTVGQTRLPTDWRLLCGLPISNSMTFTWGVGGKQKCFFYLEGLRLAHCSVLVQFPCGKHTAVPRLDMLLLIAHPPHTVQPSSIHPSIPWCSHTALSGTLCYTTPPTSFPMLEHHLLHSIMK